MEGLSGYVEVVVEGGPFRLNGFEEGNSADIVLLRPAWPTHSVLRRVMSIQEPLLLSP